MATAKITTMRLLGVPIPFQNTKLLQSHVSRSEGPSRNAASLREAQAPQPDHSVHGSAPQGWRTSSAGGMRVVQGGVGPSGPRKARSGLIAMAGL
jgi:hypothetical protein